MYIVKIGITIFLFIILFYFTFELLSFIWPNTKSVNSLKILNSGGESLAKTKPVATSDLFSIPFFTNAGGTLLFYVNIQPGQRTPDIHNPYTTIIGIPNCFSLQIPTAGSQQGTSEGRLQVFTQKNSSTIEEEYITIPSIPYQSWVQIAIIREGRRYDIAYNGKIVISQRLKYIPVVKKESLMIGSQELQGIIGLISVASRRLTIQEIKTEHQRTSDTRGKPSITSKGIMSSISICPPGVQCPSTDNLPSSPLEFWSSPYD